MNNFREMAQLIWNVADLLRGNYKQHEYGKVILPFTVLRRLDGLLAPNKAKVIAAQKNLKGKNKDIHEEALKKIAGYGCYHTSPYDFTKLAADADHIADNLRLYISQYSAGVREIMERFGFDEQIARLDADNLLYQVIKAFEKINLAPVDSMTMGYIFEELIRKFAEISNETAGEHFTPREVIELMVTLLFNEDSEILTKPGVIRSIYDPTAGTGGMLSVAETHIRRFNPAASIYLFGQEINAESYAICKSDMLIKNQEPGNIIYGDTLRNDGHAGRRFDYLLANPPFGVEWKKAQKEVVNEHETLGYKGRFGAGLPRINDGSLLFLQHMIHKMKTVDEGGARLAIVLNGSPLFTGGAGSGESEIRKWIIENDWLETIVALPDQLFFNTGISTYIWIVTNRKAKKRRGKIQLINAAALFTKMPRSLGNKRNEIPAAHIATIAQWYGRFAENDNVKIFPNPFFGYNRVTIEQPLRDEKGKPLTDKNGKIKPDAALRDYENIPLDAEISAWLKKEVWPHVPDGWADLSKTKTGYEINFTRYFYRHQPLRPLAQIRNDILALEAETDGLIKNILA